jgi:hypothetical protein
MCIRILFLEYTSQNQIERIKMITVTPYSEATSSSHVTSKRNLDTEMGEATRRFTILLSCYGDSLRAGRSGGRILVGARFSASVHTGSGGHPASYTMGTGSLLGG